jgi:hypothetical protein
MFIFLFLPNLFFSCGSRDWTNKQVLYHLSHNPPPSLKFLVQKNFQLLFIYLSIFSRTGVWTQGFTLWKQALYFLSHSSSPFWSGCFGNQVSQTLLGMAWNCSPPILSLPSSYRCELPNTWPLSAFLLSIHINFIYINIKLSYWWNKILISFPTPIH